MSAFIHARYEKIEALEPDLILGFSDLQADITTELVKRGYPVFTFNQRSVAEILQMIRVLGGIVGVPEQGRGAGGTASSAASTRSASARPRFPRAAARLLRGMGRPADQRHPLGRGAGRDRRRRADLSRAARRQRWRKDRIVTAERRHRARAPDVIIGSWCGKPVRTDEDCRAARAGATCRPCTNGHIYEIKSTYILQPGPAALTEGVRQLARRHPSGIRNGPD